MQEKYFYAGVNINVSFVPLLSADGRVVAFTSDSPLVAGDFNQNWDAFCLRRHRGAAGRPGDGAPLRPVQRRAALERPQGHSPPPAPAACRPDAKQVQVKLTVSQGTGKGNVRLYPGQRHGDPLPAFSAFTRGATEAPPST